MNWHSHTPKIKWELLILTFKSGLQIDNNRIAFFLCLLQAHCVYAELTEAKQQFDQMAEDNQKILEKIKESLDQTVEESSQKSHEEQEDAQQKMWVFGGF